jgi:hypothetical protein
VTTITSGSAWTFEHIPETSVLPPTTHFDNEAFLSAAPPPSQSFSNALPRRSNALPRVPISSDGAMGPRRWHISSTRRSINYRLLILTMRAIDADSDGRRYQTGVPSR